MWKLPEMSWKCLAELVPTGPPALPLGSRAAPRPTALGEKPPGKSLSPACPSQLSKNNPGNNLSVLICKVTR